MRCLWPCIKIEQVEITVLYSKNLFLDLLEICCLLKSDILSLCSCFHRAHGFLTWLVQDVYIYIYREREIGQIECCASRQCQKKTMNH